MCSKLVQMVHKTRNVAFARACRAHSSGAALVETLVVLPVLLTIAFNALEFSRYGQARMIVRYAQVQGMRECSVSGDHPHNPTGDANGNTLAVNAATEALRPWNTKWFTAVPGRCVVRNNGEQSPVSFSLQARYHCSYPLSFCAMAGGSMEISGLPDTELTMPMQTAFYDKKGSVPGDGKTHCAKTGTRETVEICAALTNAVDGGAPVDMAVCTTQISDERNKCAKCITNSCPSPVTKTCTDGCDSRMRSDLQAFSSGTGQCRVPVNAMRTTTCGI